MVRNRYVTEFDHPVEEVFAYVDDDTKLRQWVGGLQETKRTSPGEPGVGSTFHQKLQMGKRFFEMDGVVLEYERNRWIKVKLETDDCVMELSYKFEDINGRTRLTYNLESTYRKFLYRLLAPLTKLMGQKKLEEDFDRLKQLLSAKSVSPVPVSSVGSPGSNNVPERA